MPLTASNNGGYSSRSSWATSIYSRIGCAVSGYLSAAKLRATLRIDLAEQTDLGRIGGE
jgi:hypothetical protein